jgi:hypothetical protein
VCCSWLFYKTLFSCKVLCFLCVPLSPAHYPPGMLVYLVCPSDSLRSWLFLHPMWRTANHRPMTEEVTLPWLPVLCVPCLTHSAPEHLLPEGRLVYPPLAHSKRPGDSYTEMLNKCLIELRSSTYLKCPPHR